jgi:hypothetical protein
MWLSILIVVLIVGGLAGAIGGLGIFGIVPVFLGLVGLAILFAGRAASGPTAGSGTTETSPQDTTNAPRAHTETGYAHRGQEHMTG